ncbi:MAG: hypothetical protein IJ419_15030 [Agathobacter sp.]|nr:hypothetical protein [Agathobacter sp.]
MEKCLIWYKLSLKQNMKKLGAWLMMAAMLFLLWITTNIQMPDTANTTVAICYNESKYEGDIVQILEDSKTEFIFVGYDSDREVYEAVERGNAECGFVFDENFDQRIEKGEWDSVIMCYTSPFGTKTEVAKENLYATLYPIYSRWLLTATEEEIYKVSNPSRIEELLAKHDEYVGGTSIVTFEEVRIGGDVVDAEAESSLYPLQGLVELFVLLSMLLAAGVYGQKETAQIESALLVKEKLKFRYINLVASGTLVALTGLLVILFSEASRGMLEEILQMLFLVLAGAMGVLFFSKLFKNRLTYLSWVATFVFCFLLLRFGVAGYIAH